ncbi:human immunodeficiency virus type I enhancer-binding protein 2 homolog [Anguilla rostrata]|uniref:human immunodeficiency virus type I enhancer-binding protein 2 homolog n=1 Tax=Anguilla rostrata TaxID=7938 RepID=UPI0030CE3CB7
MEPHESAAGQKCTKEIREKNLNQRRWVSEPTASSKRSSFADSQDKRHVQCDDALSRDSGAISHMERCSPGTPPSPAVSHSSHESEIHQPLPSAFSHQSPHSYPQPPARETFPVGTKPRLQTGMDTQGWTFAGQPQSRMSDDLYQGRSRGRGAVFSRRKSPSFSFSKHSQSGKEQLEDTHKKEQRPKKPGKYICHYCGRACAKPSVLKKHIRSHTGERPYPCVPCGFSFKTKSNLYKHRKSHAHAIKAGLVPFSELTSTRVDTDQTSPLGEGEVHSDGEQSTDTDEDTGEVLTLFGKSSPLPHMPLEADRSTTGKDVSETSFGEEFSGDGARGSANLPLLIVPKQGILVPAVQCSKLTEIEVPPVSPREGGGEECHTVKQRLALRLHEKKGQDSESSFNLLSPHSKGSTDSGYFSRSESAEQQVSPPITNAKSYEEIMFGKYYRPSPRPRQSITVGMATTAHKDINVADITGKRGVVQKLAMSDISDDHISHHYAKDKNIVDSANLHANIFLRGNLIGTQRIEGFSQKQYPLTHCQVNTVLEAPSDTGSLIRSNSMPTSSTGNLDIPPGLRGSHSFDERMKDEVFYPGSGGLRRLRRQAAFELSSHEGHAESDTQGTILKTTVLLSGAAKLGEHSPLVPELKGYSSYSTKVGMEGYPEFQLQLMHQRQAMESATRKRRKEKSVGDDDDSPSHCSSDHSSSIEMLGSPEDCDSKLLNQDPLRATSTGKGHIHNVYSQLDSIDIGTRMSLEDRMLIQDPDRKATGNVISVIQHTNSLSRPSSFEKSDSVDHSCYQQGKPSSFYCEQSDSENTEEVQSMGPVLRSESMEQQQSDCKTVHTPHRLVRQSNIQVPEIRVTEEPEKPEKSPEAQVKEPEKHVEEFQWPQRSETLSQLPAEKLPPKKKRLRLAEIEHSSGESSFESTCTSLSRSPSQESNLSHTSSLSVSLDREESIKSASPVKQEDLGRQSEFLTVPGLTQHQQREMRRSSSEQVPCTLPIEIPGSRSKSFDYGSLSSSSRQGEIYASASSMKERRRGYLVRQASLSVHPESVVQDKTLDAKQEQSEQMLNSLHRSHPAWQSAPLPLLGTDCDVLVADVTRHKRTIHPVLSLHTHPLQLSINDQSDGHLVTQKLSHSPGQQPSGTDNATHEIPSGEVAWYSSLHSSIAQPQFLPFQPGILWHQESTKRHKQHTPLHTHQLQKMQIKPSCVLQSHQKPLHSPQLPQIQEQVDSKILSCRSDQSYLYTPKTSPYQVSDLSGAFSMSPLLVPLSQASLPGIVVPVRVQTNVPSYGSLMYTSVSQMLVTLAQGGTSSSMVMCNVSDVFQNALPKPGIGLSPILTEPEGSSHYHCKVSEPMPVHINTGIPLSLTCGTISTTDASSMGGNKRMLSPASSLEFFSEIKQQKRVKEERMYGQIVEELSAVELSNSGAANDGGELQKTSPQKDDISSKLFSLYTDEACRSGHSTPPRPMLLDSPEGRESPEKLEVDEQACEEGQSSTLSTDDAEEVKPVNNDKTPETMQMEHPSEGGSFLLTSIRQASQFLSLRTSTSVSWCFLNYTKPNNAQTVSLSSVYASWSVSSYNPNPPSLSTKAALALLCSKQKKNTAIYTMAAMYQPGMGKLVSSYFCTQKSDQGNQELMQLNIIKSEKKTKGVSCRERVKEDHREKEVSQKQAEPTRIKIFEGGYKSNEDYIYVRGRGRGKYICEECGIRCKKPSMLKKHIRSHTDVRPYVCKFCNFAFKTKGNLTKHMKSKAHMKKCLELGVPVTSVEDAEVEEPDNADYDQKDSGKVGMSGVVAEHQFSDVDDSEGPEDDGDEIEEDDDDDDEYEGDSTPRTRSRSASPRPNTIASLPTSRDPATEFPGSAPKPPLFSYFPTLPSIQITQLAGDSCCSESQVHLQPARSNKEHGKNLDIQSSIEEDISSTSFDTPLSHLLSPTCGSSPTRESSSPSRRYLSPKRDLSPRGGLSPRREASPLHHIAPKKRDLSPRAHLSPAPLGRPLSPGRDITGKRELSPRSRHRGMIRTVSPRRGSHHHSAPWDLGQYLLPEAGQLNQEKRKSPLQGMRLSGEVTGSQDSTTVAQRGLFSHLPLHSQQQVRTPLPMIPIGGIQVVHSATGPAQPARLPLWRDQSEDSSAGDVPSHLPESGTNTQATDGAPRSQEKLFSSLAAPTAACSAYSSPQDQVLEVGGEECRQDESIQTCTRAIASLKIASEEALEKATEAVKLHPPSPHNQIPSEDMQVRIQNVSGSEQDSSQADMSAPPPESLGSEKDKLGTPETSLGHNTFYCKSAIERQSGQQGLREMPKSTKTGKDSSKETMEYR